MLGDFNIVEDAIDRLPSHGDDPDAVSDLLDLKRNFNLIDGWRHIFESTRGYSFHQEATGAMSRIDRIYISEKDKHNFTEWGICEPNFNTDHKMVFTSLIDRKSPHIGPGRWVLPKFLLKDKKFMYLNLPRNYCI